VRSAYDITVCVGKTADTPVVFALSCPLFSAQKTFRLRIPVRNSACRGATKKEPAAIMKKFATKLLCAAILATPLSGLSSTLIDVYNMALENDPQLGAARAAYEAGLEFRNISRSALLPRVVGSAEYSETDSDEYSRSVFVLDGNTVNSGSRGSGDADQTVFALSLTQPIFNLPAWYDHKRGATVSEQARTRFAADQQDLILRVTEAYFNVLRASENLSSAIAEEEAIGRQLEQTRQRYEVGLLPITDVHEAQATFDDARVNTLELRGALNVAFEALEVLTGQPHGQLAGLTGNFPVQNPEPENREEWVLFSLQNNLDLKAAQLARDAAGHNADARKAEHLPTLTGSYNYRDSDQDKSFRGRNLNGDPINTPSINENESHVLALRLEMPIFTGGLVSANRRQAYHQFVEAEELARAAQRNVTQQARTAHLNVVTNAARVTARAQAITSAESALEATRAGYEVGTRNIVDVLFAERTLYQAKRNYANARYDYVASNLELKKVAGQLSPEDVQRLNAWLDPSLVIEPTIVR